jgi:hypothetical protein
MHFEALAICTDSMSSVNFTGRGDRVGWRVGSRHHQARRQAPSGNRPHKIANNGAPKLVNKSQTLRAPHFGAQASFVAWPIWPSAMCSSEPINVERRKHLVSAPIMKRPHIQYRQAGTDQLARHPTPEAAIEATCCLIDQGCDVYAVGTGPLTDSIAPDQIARIYGIWVRAKRPFGLAPTRAVDQSGSNSGRDSFRRL